MSFESNLKVYCVHAKCKKRAAYRLLPSERRTFPEPVCRAHLEYHAFEGDRVEPLVGSMTVKPIKAERPDDLQAFIGKTLKCMDGQWVKVETIKGSVFKQSRFEINGAHHVVMLSAYKQLAEINGDYEVSRDITQEDIDAFDEIVCEKVEQIKRPAAIDNVITPKFKGDAS